MPTRNDRPTVKTQASETNKPRANQSECHEESPMIKDSPENAGEAITMQPPKKDWRFLENKKKN